MQPDFSLEKCRSYMDCQLQSRSGEAGGKRARESGPAVTISRQTGSGARVVTEALALYLNERGPEGPCSWTIFDRSLVEKVLEDHNLPKQLAEYMREDRRSYIADVMEELVGLHPASWTLVRQTMETVLRLAEMGRVILVGRGANVITARLRGVFHVRLVGSLETRIKRVMAEHSLGAKEAEEHVHKEDRGRKRYLRENFEADMDDPLLYHLVLNTDRIPLEAGRIIGEAALRMFRSGGR